MSDYIQYAIDAISLGGLYALSAVAIALIFGVMRMVNFAQGDFITCAGYAILLFGVHSTWLIIPVALAGAVLVALLVERAAFRPVRNASMPTLLIASFAASAVIQNLIILIAGSTPRSVGILESVSASFVTIGGVRIAVLDIVTTVTTLSLLGLLTVCLYKTSLGLQLRAAAENFTVARMVGVRANRIIAAAFAITGVLAGSAAGLLLAKTGALSPTLGLQLTLVGFVATIIGGMGNLFGAAAGAYLIAIITVALQTALPVQIRGYRDAFVYGIIVLFLVLWPDGIFGARGTVERV
ncbi:MAG: hypothetical protein BGO11_17125 [Solirubrobacterales bacterium 70-9]|nr:MAG: hypothetical protein BGO11_17125 [Solirubrobacterales bacterium 70-9]